MAVYFRILPVIFWFALTVSAVSMTYDSVAVARLTSTQVQDAPLERGDRAGKNTGKSAAGFFSCASFVLDPQLEMQLRQLDLHFGREELSKSQTRLSTTLEFLKRYLSCKPTNAYAWTRAALVSNTMMSDADATATYLALSIYYAPYQAELVKTRNSVINALSPRLKDEYKDLLFQRPATAMDGNAAN